MADKQPVTREQALHNLEIAIAQAQQRLETAESQEAYWAERKRYAQLNIDTLSKLQQEVLARKD